MTSHQSISPQHGESFHLLIHQQGNQRKVAGVVDEAAGVVDEVAGVVDEIAGVVDEVAGVVDEVAGVVDEVAGVVDEIAEVVDEIELESKLLVFSLCMMKGCYVSWLNGLKVQQIEIIISLMIMQHGAAHEENIEHAGQ